MIRLMNSAMMPRPGVYKCLEINKEDFVRQVQAARKQGTLRNYVGYDNTIDYVNKICSFKGKDKLAVSREETFLENEDVLLVIKLKYRIKDASDKGKMKPNEDDYVFYEVKYNT